MCNIHTFCSFTHIMYAHTHSKVENLQSDVTFKRKTKSCQNHANLNDWLRLNSLVRTHNHTQINTFTNTHACIYPDAYTACISRKQPQSFLMSSSSNRDLCRRRKMPAYHAGLTGHRMKEALNT